MKKLLLIITLITSFSANAQVVQGIRGEFRDSVTSLTNNTDLILKGRGTGLVNIEGAYTLPGSDGTNGQALTTNGDGVVSFSDISGFTVTNEADNRVITSTGAGTGNAEANMTFDASTLTLAADLDFSGANHNITNMGDIDFQTGATGGTIRTGTSNADKWALQAYDVNGAAYQTVASAHAGNDPLFHLFSNSLRFTDASDNTKRASFDLSGITTGTTRAFTFPDQAGTFALTSDLSSYQPLDADLTTIAGLSSADGNFIVGSAGGWVVESGATARTSLGFTNPILDKASPGDIGGTTAAAGSFTTGNFGAFANSIYNTPLRLVYAAESNGAQESNFIAESGFHYPLIAESDDAVIGLVSRNEGFHSSGIDLVEINSGVLEDRWTLVRSSSNLGTGDDARMNIYYGSDPDYTANKRTVELFGDGSATFRKLLTDRSFDDTFGFLAFEAANPRIRSVGDDAGTWGAAFTLDQMDLSGATDFENTWGITRQTNGDGSGDGRLSFTYGTNTDPAANSQVVQFSTAGQITSTALTGTGERLMNVTSGGAHGAITNGTDGQVMTMVSSSPAWADNSGAISSSTYVPTITDVANTSARSVRGEIFFVEYADFVLVQGAFNITPTSSATLTKVRWTLPVATTFSTNDEVTGTGSSAATASSAPEALVTLYADITNNEIELAYTSFSSGSGTVVRWQCAYEK